MQKYYPKKYGPFKLRKNRSKSITDLPRQWAASYCINKRKNPFKHPLGFLLFKVFGAGFAEKFEDMNIPFNAKILDIGSGAGQHLLTLKSYGFKNLMGIDLFIDSDIHYKNDINIKKTDIYNINEKHDLVMLNHVLEHMNEQDKVVQRLYNLIDDEGIVMIRIPVNDCYSYRKYGKFWVALDAPRHFYVHTVKSLTYLFRNNGFELLKLTYDSSEYQFWASEQYQRGISLFDPKSYYVNKNDSIFNKKQIRNFRNKAIELNKINDGNAAIFFFKKTRKDT
jgi:predicted SAM-dependent methyltransferase